MSDIGGALREIVRTSGGNKTVEAEKIIALWGLQDHRFLIFAHTHKKMPLEDWIERVTSSDEVEHNSDKRA